MHISYKNLKTNVLLLLANCSKSLEKLTFLFAKSIPIKGFLRPRPSARRSASRSTCQSARRSVGHAVLKKREFKEIQGNLSKFKKTRDVSKLLAGRAHPSRSRAARVSGGAWLTGVGVNTCRGPGFSLQGPSFNFHLSYCLINIPRCPEAEAYYHGKNITYP